VIPKPGKADYSEPKAYRPISLLECCRKLLEKIVAKRFLADINSLQLLPPRQFGSRDYHSAVDAASVLVHTVESCLNARRVAAVLLFNIQGFFNNIHQGRAAQVLRNLGFPASVCDWVASFLWDRRVFLSFNKKESDPFDVNSGTPQGSPLSPILSALYTSPLLHKLQAWNNRDLSLYVDDGSIIATGPTYRSTAQAIASGFDTAWLKRNGLRAEPDKTELMSFAPKHPKPSPIYGTPITSLALRDPYRGTYTVRPQTTMRYLGIFLHHRLDWSHHAKIMAMRAQSVVRSLHILGNSVRGLNFANWQKVYHAIVLPVLAYGAPVWYTGVRQKKICQTLQIAQNDAIRRITGCFRTTPTEPLHSLISIPPIKYTLDQALDKIRNNYKDRDNRPSQTCRTNYLPFSLHAHMWTYMQQVSI